MINYSFSSTYALQNITLKPFGKELVYVTKMFSSLIAWLNFFKETNSEY